jgi:protein required for attachment to host cells
MYRTCIALVDASRARLFMFDRASESDGLHEQLSEQRDLVNPARRLRTSELFSDSRPGVGRSGDLQYGLDDHRADHVDHMAAEFARAALVELEELIRGTGAKRLIVCASPSMLGALRAAGLDQWEDRIVIDTLSRDYVKLTPPELRVRLAEHALLPAPEPRVAVARS